ncbi:hypothetical protein [Escherichia coli]|nr:hypothetical protein [Escherichia coli]
MPAADKTSATATAQGGLVQIRSTLILLWSAFGGVTEESAMPLEFEKVRMYSTVLEMRPFITGEKYEAKVTNVYGYDGNEISLPKGGYLWGLGWGKTSQEARDNAVNSAINELKNCGIEVGDRK